MNITIFGTGYVGLVSGTCFAALGHKVLCVDIDESKVETLRQGNVPIYEPGLEILINETAQMGNLAFSSNFETAITHSSIYFIAVGTPQSLDGSANLSYVFDLAREIGRFVSLPSIVVVKSTVPVGTAIQINEILSTELRNRNLDPYLIKVVSNPEFLKEGQAIADFMEPDRVVIGSLDEDSAQIVSELYKSLNLSAGQILMMDNNSAELTKYAANAMLATRISFMNQIANFAQACGANIDHVKLGIASDLRIGPYFLNAGAGYGGSCFPKDVKALINACIKDGGFQPTLLQAVDEVNELQKSLLVDVAIRYLDDLKGKTIGIWGLSFKPETDDIREATSQVVVSKLLQEGATVVVYDPVAVPNFSRAFKASQIKYCDTAQEVLENIDALFVLTEWDEFKTFDKQILIDRLNGKLLLDGRNIYRTIDFASSDVDYYSIGRPV